MSDRYQTFEEKPYESHYLLMDTLINYPTEKVWPHALVIHNWMNAHRFEPIEGESGKVGRFERLYPSKIGVDVPSPHYHLYGIASVIPWKLIALEVMPEKGGSYGEKRPWASFDSILFTDLGDKTLLTVLMIDVLQGKGDETAHLREDAKLERTRGLLERFFENLRRQVAAACDA